MAAFSLGSLSVIAQSVPTTINYQGRLTDNSPQQAPVNGVVSMQFEIWDAASGGTRLWREPNSDGSGTNVPVTGGIFSLLLGQVNPLPNGLYSGGGDRYLQIILNPGATPEPLLPRQQVGSAVYAMQAQKAFDSNQLGGIGAAQYQGRTVVPTCPAGQFLQTIAATGAPTCVPDAGFSVPMSLSGNLSTPIFSSVNNGTGTGVSGSATAGMGVNGTATTTGTGVQGTANGTGGTGVHGTAAFGTAVKGTTVSGVAVDGYSSSGTAIQGYSNSSSGVGVSGGTLGGGIGVSGSATTGSGVKGTSTSGTAVRGDTSTGGALGVGVEGNHGDSGNFGRLGTASFGVEGDSASGYGVQGASGSGRGVFGFTTGLTGFTYGVLGEAASTTGRGVYGRATATSGNTNGVVGQSDSPQGAGVRAIGDSNAATALRVESGGIQILGAGIATHTAVFQVNGGGSNTCGPNGNSCLITDNSQINGNPNAFLIVTMYQTYQPSPLYVSYNVSGCPVGRWVICRSDTNSMVGFKVFALAFQAP